MKKNESTRYQSPATFRDILIAAAMQIYVTNMHDAETKRVFQKCYETGAFEEYCNLFDVQKLHELSDELENLLS